jgi:hypothetical protein
MIDPSAARAKAAEIQALHDRLHSWRKVAALYPGVPAGTLNRIAKSGGQYLPKDKRLLRALFGAGRRERTQVQKAITKMARNTRKAVMVIRRQK